MRTICIITLGLATASVCLPAADVFTAPPLEPIHLTQPLDGDKKSGPPATTSGSDPAPKTKRTHDINADDYFTQAYVDTVAISPDGKYVAYPEKRWQADTNDRKSDLWVVTSGTNEVRRLTSERGGDYVPKWSPDGRWVYFAGIRKRNGETRAPYDGTLQVWRVSVDGGEPTPVTRVVGGLRALSTGTFPVAPYDLSTDGKTLYYVTEKEARDQEWQALRERFSHIEYGHGGEQVQSSLEAEFGDLAGRGLGQ